MKLIALTVAAAATLFTVLPASAQVEIRERGDSARVTVNEGHHMNRGHHYGWRNHHADCRVVKVKKRVGHRVIIKTTRMCR